MKRALDEPSDFRSDAHAARTICRTWADSRLKVSSSIRSSQTRGRGSVDLDLVEHAAFRQHDDAIGQEHRFGDVMGDENHRRPPLLPDPGQFFLQRHAGLRIDAGERLVHQQDFGIVGQRAHHADALLHAAGQFVGIAVGGMRQAGKRQIFVRDPVALGLRHAAHLRTEADIVEHGLPGKQREGLKHHAALRARVR